MLCTLIARDGKRMCARCGWVYRGTSANPQRQCQIPPDYTEQLDALARLTGDSSVIDHPDIYGRLAAAWNDAGQPMREPDEAEFIVETICPRCEFYHAGRCRQFRRASVAVISQLDTASCPRRNW